MIDISVRKDEPSKAVAYLDGADARMFKMLVKELGSEKAAQSAIILEGLLIKLEKSGGVSSKAKILQIRKLFQRLVGVSYREFESIFPHNYHSPASCSTSPRRTS